MPRKVRNPKTGFMVTVGGEAWKKMQKRRKRAKSAKKRKRSVSRKRRVSRKRKVSRKRRYTPRRKYKRRRRTYARYGARNVYRQDAGLCHKAANEGYCNMHPQCQWIMATQKCRARMGTRQAGGPVYQGPINLPPEARAKIKAATDTALMVVKDEKKKAIVRAGTAEEVRARFAAAGDPAQDSVVQAMMKRMQG